ncbi:MAG: GTPase Era [Lachnospiraceae bacterium]|nr:GTPase Era [Lachnospiraceae bacterium]
MDKGKSGFVTIVGRPNVGKSTLMNHLIRQKIAITANKPQTTRDRIRTVYTDERGQVIFLDTPGIHKAKTRLGEYMVETAVKTVPDADVVLWIVEPAAKIGRGEEEIAKLLGKAKKPVVLVINKIDTVPKEEVQKTAAAFEGMLPFERVLYVSALRSVRTEDVMDAIFELLPYGPMYYDEDTVTDQPMQKIAAEMIREKALRTLSEEVPHGIAVVTDKMQQRKDGLWEIEASIYCEKESHKGIIIGKGGQMLKKIGSEARADIEKMVEGHASLRLFVKVRKDWRDNTLYLKNLGYSDGNE